MRNKNIRPGDIVPKKIRKGVYEKAIKTIQAGRPVYALSSFSLCLMLPCILWDLTCFLDEAPCGQGYDSTDAQIMFPELTEERLDSITSLWGDNQEKKDIQRIEVLTEMLAEL